MVMTEAQRKQARKATQQKYNAKDEVRQRQAQFVKENYKQIMVRINVDKEADMLSYLMSRPDGASTYLKKLLKNDMEESLP